MLIPSVKSQLHPEQWNSAFCVSPRLPSILQSKICLMPFHTQPCIARPASLLDGPPLMLVPNINSPSPFRCQMNLKALEANPSVEPWWPDSSLSFARCIFKKPPLTAYHVLSDSSKRYPHSSRMRAWNPP